jgi:hypothetical protein
VEKNRSCDSDVAREKPKKCDFLISKQKNSHCFRNFRRGSQNGIEFLTGILISRIVADVADRTVELISESAC